MVKPDLNTPVGDFLEGTRIAMRELREISGLSQSQVAERMGTQQQNIAKLELHLHYRLQISTLVRFANACGYQVVLSFEELPGE